MEHDPSPASVMASTTAETPPLLRGSIPASPWFGAREAWRRLRGQSHRAVPQFDTQPALPWQAVATRRRSLLVLLMALTCIATSLVLLRVLDWRGMPILSLLQLLLFVPLVAWVSAGFWSAMMGFVVMLKGDRHVLSARQAEGVEIPTDARSAIIMPICNEHVPTVIAGLQATCESLSATGQAGHFDVFMLSDTRDPARQAEERAAWQALRAELDAKGGPRVFYRVRKRPGKRKAGNVADFCRRWGRLYRYMVVLDADSVMSGECLTGLVKLMEANPRAGIIQTVPRPCGQTTLHARAQQFASRVTGSLFTAGMQFWQLGDSHYWGHNAIIRIEAFMRHCGLARLEGEGRLSGDVLSHDFIEAALIRRAGYHVWVVPDLPGSFEQVPCNLLDELQRDRRWCLGNMLNARLIVEPGLTPAHRAMLLTGVLAYASAPLWLCYLLVGTLAWGFVDYGELTSTPTALQGLWWFTAVLLMLPRVLGVAAICLRGEQVQFGGTLRLVASALIEAVLSVLQAPIRMFAHTSFVIAAITGVKLEWKSKSPPREADALSWRDAARGFFGDSLLAAQWGVLAQLSHPAAALWLAPVYAPLVGAIPLAVTTGDLRLGRSIRARQLLLVPEEARTPRVLTAAWRYANMEKASLPLAA
ncbi:MAG: glucan biosynthesis glucosyltransferase H [Candidatus Dactylopiibacterium carminicum]|uniref:Glucans biosynthesis glucosyltransferase H n=1 Tax=Candidatus Dactylopiibacterium carminicum TaxID=857335 RepID=A0A272ENT2_9RHOO|nr:glucans biosynthesis glucosyltransferase MdoH [Candidatus Dactylopiibacterium carminicum]KAF7599541.1 glucans biosynthesis glucosyltransferase MdoH [Candidatus Dactylopiibacterium carminicum]PAS91774.1 MAG: glucan biosynthesis glucosyltransferase H [Candidatus Dactylopiibacterium carminicum]PAS99546.1 MAG: glucan biosynthesis glucosyltransferase H [Candidatus Dactylopiibacterium carminicum]